MPRSPRLQGVLEWIGKLSTNPVLLDAVDVLYNSDKQNIRNRIMHGNLLEIEGKDLEVSLPIANPALFRSVAASGPDAYSPENIAQHCLSCLDLVDREIAGPRPLVAAGLAWNAGFILSSDEVEATARVLHRNQTRAEVRL